MRTAAGRTPRVAIVALALTFPFAGALTSCLGTGVSAADPHKESSPRTTASRTAETPAKTTPVTAVTYNIRHGRGNDEVVDLARTAAVLRRLDADIVGLEEVDSLVLRSHRIDEADSLGKLLGMHAAFSAFFDYQGGKYGMGMLSRNPIISSHSLRLPEGNEPRTALFAFTTTRSGDTIAVVVVHFDWVSNDSFRLSQARILAASLDTMSVPYILLGDFNDVPSSQTLSLFRSRALEARKPEESRYSFPSDDPATEIDYIFVAPESRWRIGAVSVIDERLASDHRPVRALLEFIRE